jgi:hypothetical protein
MKKRILINVILCAIFCAVPVAAQKSVQKKTTEIPLVTEAVKLSKLEIKSPAEGFNGLSGEAAYLLEILKPLSSRRGSVEIVAGERTLIVTDTNGRVKLITGLVKTLDDSGMLIDDLMSETSKEGEKTITESVKANYIFPLTSCLDGKESPWMVIQGFLLFRPMKKLNVRIRSSRQNDGEVEVTGTEMRVELAKKVIALFNRPFLTEVEDYDI